MLEELASRRPVTTTLVAKNFLDLSALVLVAQENETAGQLPDELNLTACGDGRLVCRIRI